MSNTQNLGQTLAIVKWLSNHAAQLPAIVANCQTVTSPTASRDDKIAAVHSLVDLLASIASDFPLPLPNVVGALPVEQHHFDAEVAPLVVGANGDLIKWLITNGSSVIALISGIVQLFK